MQRRVGLAVSLDAVVTLSTRGGHGMPIWSVDDVYDYHRQIVGWWDEHLKAAKKPTS